MMMANIHCLAVYYHPSFLSVQAVGGQEIEEPHSVFSQIILIIIGIILQMHENKIMS